MAAGAMEEAWGILWAGDIARVGGQEERGLVGEVGSAGKEGGGGGGGGSTTICTIMTRSSSSSSHVEAIEWAWHAREVQKQSPDETRRRKARRANDMTRGVALDLGSQSQPTQA